MLALMRGSGATGLAAIEPGPTHPILSLRRHETLALCTELGLDAAIDPTNSDPRFRRNRVRSELLPLMHSIAERDVTALLNRTSDVLRDDDALLDELSLALDPTDARAISTAPLPLARRAIRRLLSVDGFPPDAAAIARVLAVAAGETSACEVTGVGRVERSQQRLRIVSTKIARRGSADD
jgi:tRNA(Ile)-lysidine synthase